MCGPGSQSFLMLQVDCSRRQTTCPHELTSASSQWYLPCNLPLLPNQPFVLFAVLSPGQLKQGLDVATSAHFVKSC